MSKLHLIENLAVSDSGFLFLHTTGETFTLNKTGSEIVRMLRSRKSKEEILKFFTENYIVDTNTIEKDFEELVAQLKFYSLVTEK